MAVIQGKYKCTVEEKYKISVVVNAAGQLHANAISTAQQMLKIKGKTVAAKKLIKAIQEEWWISGGNDGNKKVVKVNETSLQATGGYQGRRYNCGEQGHKAYKLP